MTPAARLQAVIDILSADTAQPLERQLKAWFRGHRFAGSGDRRAITERIYAIQRRHAHFAHRMASESPRDLVIASLLAEGEDPVKFFTDGYGPKPLSDGERAAIDATPAAEPLWVQGEYPQWLEEELRRAFGNRILDEMRAFQERAPVDIRVNTLKAGRDALLVQLKADGIDGAPLDDLPDAIRCPPGVALTAHPLYQAGAFKFRTPRRKRR